MAGLIETLREWLSAETEERPSPDEGSAMEVAQAIADNPRTVELRDGRQLGYADLGDPDGAPLLVFHGFPNSRVFGALFDAVGQQEGVRVLAPERPGIGVSDPLPDRTLTDWPADVVDFADALDLERFAVLGISGGGPYAAVTAAKLPDRLTHAGIACGLAPMDSVGLRERAWYYLARYLPPVSKLLLWVIARRARSDRAAFLSSMAESASSADEHLWLGEVGKVVHASAVESTRRHGLDPLVQETAIYGSPWGFDLGEISVPTTLWYGNEDVLVPPEMGRYLETEIPTAEAHFYPELDHLSTFTAHDVTILETLTP